jgi:asparagine synthase (glutamine-hydrolysing)
MCGICGSFLPRLADAGDRAVVAGMMRRLEHRGPDGSGLWSHSQAVLGHLRLAIIDLEGGYQPQLNETETIGVVFNGEIYNFAELRRLLLSAGHVFRTRSDTEVIVHGYEEWGFDLLPRLRGMFAFAVWDGRARRMVLARDRFGVKPLYYHRDRQGRLIFASEIKALFVDPAVPRTVNEPRLAEYLTYRSIAGEETLFEDIREVAPGTLMVLDGDRIETRRYWTPEVPIGAPRAADVETGRRLLYDAVASRLVSDVPLGTITSGGLDSSLVSALAADAAHRSIDTFCAGFADPSYDERPFARAVAGRIGSRHHDIEVTPDAIDRELDRLTWAHDEPLTHPNSIPMHLIFREAKEAQHVTVLLSGEGADEVFGGYEWYAVAHKRERLRRVPMLDAIGGLLPGRKGAILRKVLHPDYLLAANATFPPAQVRQFGVGGADPLASRRPLWPASNRGWEGLFVYDQRTYLPPLLQRQDRMSMAAGLEAREPFLDHVLVEWANALPASVKIPGGGRKQLLKEIAAPNLPADIIHRRKVGFAMPIGEWLRPGGALADRVANLTADGTFVRRFLNRSALGRLITEHDSRAADHTDVLWSLIALESWADTFLRGSVRETILPGVATGRPLGQPAAVGE